MKKTILSLFCLLAIAATGFSQQKGSRLTAGQNKPVFRNSVPVNFEQDYGLKTDYFFQQEPVCILFKPVNAVKAADYTMPCIPKQLFIDKIINELFINQY